MYTYEHYSRRFVKNRFANEHLQLYSWNTTQLICILGDHELPEFKILYLLYSIYIHSEIIIVVTKDLCIVLLPLCILDGGMKGQSNPCNNFVGKEAEK